MGDINGEKSLSELSRNEPELGPRPALTYGSFCMLKSFACSIACNPINDFIHPSCCCNTDIPCSTTANDCSSLCPNRATP